MFKCLTVQRHCNHSIVRCFSTTVSLFVIPENTPSTRSIETEEPSYNWNLLFSFKDDGLSEQAANCNIFPWTIFRLPRWNNLFLVMYSLYVYVYRYISIQAREYWYSCERGSCDNVWSFHMKFVNKKKILFTHFLCSVTGSL